MNNQFRLIFFSFFSCFANNSNEVRAKSITFGSIIILCNRLLGKGFRSDPSSLHIPWGKKSCLIYFWLCQKLEQNIKVTWRSHVINMWLCKGQISRYMWTEPVNPIRHYSFLFSLVLYVTYFFSLCHCNNSNIIISDTERLTNPLEDTQLRRHRARVWTQAVYP